MSPGNRLGDEGLRLMHLVPAPAVRLSCKDECYPDQALTVYWLKDKMRLVCHSVFTFGSRITARVKEKIVSVGRLIKIQKRVSQACKCEPERYPDDHKDRLTHAWNSLPQHLQRSPLNKDTRVLATVKCCGNRLCFLIK